MYLKNSTNENKYYNEHKTITLNIKIVKMKIKIDQMTRFSSSPPSPEKKCCLI